MQWFRFGQGSCLAIEDSYCLAEILDKKEFIDDAKKLFDDLRLSDAEISIKDPSDKPS